jgi:hypothetical protein
MTYPIAMVVRVSPDGIGTFDFGVSGLWVNDHIENIKVVHGEELLSEVRYPVLVQNAKKQAENKMLRYQEEQRLRRDNILHMLCRTF